MPAYSKKSYAKLDLCHQDLIVLFTWVIRFYDCTILETYRNRVDQEDFFKKGASRVHYPSYHNCKPCFAADVSPYEEGHIDWDLKQCIFFNAYVMGIAAMLLNMKLITHKIKSGLDWDSDNDINDTLFVDATHFFIEPLPGELMNFVP